MSGLHWTSGLPWIHAAIEAGLVALVWLFCGRTSLARRRLDAFETERDLMKKRFEAATAGLHLRLLHAERQLRQAAAPPPHPTPDAGGTIRRAESSEQGNTTSAGGLNVSTVPHSRGELSRGEMDLLRKVRHLTAAGGGPVKNLRAPIGPSTAPPTLRPPAELHA